MNKQINLLPDSKQDRLKERRARQMVTTIASLIIVVAIGVPIFLLVIKGSQQLYLSRLQDQIDANKNTINSTANIATILTVKDHLTSLSGLYANRAISTELLSILPSVTPQGVKFSSLEFDNSTYTLIITGSAAKYSDVEKFYRALSNIGAEVNVNRVEPDPSASGLFTGETLQSVSGSSGVQVDFTINAVFDPKVIDGVPNG